MFLKLHTTQYPLTSTTSRWLQLTWSPQLSSHCSLAPAAKCWRLPARFPTLKSLPSLVMFCSLSPSWPHPSASRSKSKVNFFHEPSISPTPALLFHINAILPDNVQKHWRLELRHGLCPHHIEPTSKSHCALYSNRNTPLETL